MSAHGSALAIHSLAEARLYLKVTPCRACRGGPLIPDPQAAAHDPDQQVLNVPVSCRACGKRQEILFDTSGVEVRESIPAACGELLAPADRPTPAPINPTDEPSRIIDVAGWFTLHTVIAEAARTAGADARTLASRAAKRRLLIEAGQCLDEALKFFDADNDLPPEDAFFHHHSRRRFRDRPELFTRQRLIDLLRQLPH